MKPLSLRQRQILFLMNKADGPVLFSGGTRGFEYGELDNEAPGSLVIRAYQSPEFFLERRKLIQRIEMNARGRWYRLTDEGVRRAVAIQQMPRSPRRRTKSDRRQNWQRKSRTPSGRAISSYEAWIDHQRYFRQCRKHHHRFGENCMAKRYPACIVEPGDTLTHIAQRELGDVSKWKLLAHLNRLKDPGLIHPGDLIILPRPVG